jgi:hypothetical protein
MPFGFPSHQGLILPLWRRWPLRFDALCLCVGAVMPDVVDGIACAIRWEEFGQGGGHSIVGALTASVPLGLAIAWVLRRALPGAWVARLDEGAPPRPWPWRRAVESMAVGVASHIFFDFISHKNMLLFWPWWTSKQAFPDWWTHRWSEVNVYVYAKPYAIAPHSLVWGALSVLGIVLFVRSVRRREGDAA